MTSAIAVLACAFVFVLGCTSVAMAAGAPPRNFATSFDAPSDAPEEAPAITSAGSTTFVEGTEGSFSVTATGVPSPTITETGTLPTGVTFIGGVLSGTPTQSGVFPITFDASNGVEPEASQSFTLTVEAAPAITSANNATFTKGTAGKFKITATGLPSPTITETGTLPTGVTLKAGALSGTPTQEGVFTITLTATNSAGFVNQSFTLTVDSAPVFTSANNTTFTPGVAGSFTVTATGNPAPTFTEQGLLPSGVTFNEGVLSGTTTQSGTFQIEIIANNGVVSYVSQEFTLTVLGFRITTASLPLASPEKHYSVQLTATEGLTPVNYRWVVTSGALPTGFKLDRTTGVIGGTVKAKTVTSTFTVTLTNKADKKSPQKTTATFTLEVA